MNPIFSLDFYKTGHQKQYPEGTEMVYSNLTPRSEKWSNLPDDEYNDNRVVLFGLRYFIQKVLVEDFEKEFFGQPKEKVIGEYKKLLDVALNSDNDVSHIEELHDLGYLPIEIRALEEGTAVPYGTPMLTIRNTLPKFYWLTNYLETILSAMIWKPCTSATTARWYKNLLLSYAEKTGVDPEFVQWQGHDFSFRGMSGGEDAALSGAAHLQYFFGTDTIPAIKLLQDYYGAGDFVGGSVPATEHSVMCLGGKDTEIDTFKRLINEVYPSGIVSIVSDTWDFWQVVTDYVAELKEDIMNRDGKVVIRPDSGDPVKIICGDPEAPAGSPENLGAVECLWNVFGGTETEKGFRVLDEHIGLIYGDSITPERAKAILHGLALKGFASSNIVFGIGSYTYQHVTRDTHGFAVKATYGIVNGEPREIFKDPKTDSGTKKSARGLLRVNPDLTLTDQVSINEAFDNSMLKVVFEG